MALEEPKEQQVESAFNEMEHFLRTTLASPQTGDMEKRRAIEAFQPHLEDCFGSDIWTRCLNEPHTFPIARYIGLFPPQVVFHRRGLEDRNENVYEHLDTHAEQELLRVAESSINHSLAALGFRYEPFELERMQDIGALASRFDRRGQRLAASREINDGIENQAAFYKFAGTVNGYLVSFCLTIQTPPAQSNHHTVISCKIFNVANSSSLSSLGIELGQAGGGGWHVSNFNDLLTSVDSAINLAIQINKSSLTEYFNTRRGPPWKKKEL